MWGGSDSGSLHWVCAGTLPSPTLCSNRVASDLNSASPIDPAVPQVVRQLPPLQALQKPRSLQRREQKMMISTAREVQGREEVDEETVWCARKWKEILYKV